LGSDKRRFVIKRKKGIRWFVGEIIYWYLLADIPTSIGLRLRHLYYSSSLGECGKDVKFPPRIKILSPEKIVIGDRVGLGEEAIIDGEYPIEIGNDTLIGFQVVILTSTHCHHNPGIPIREQGSKGGPVKIGSDVWIGARSFIMPGVTIGNGSVVGACSVVTSDLPDYSISAGIPAKIIGSRKK